MAKKPVQKPLAETWKSPGSGAELSGADQLAHAIVSRRPDLLPSVERIMVAQIALDDRLSALTLFDTALGTPGDPNRDPRVAIGRFPSLVEQSDTV